MARVIVIAFKFNDVFYALNTQECIEAQHKTLIIMTTPNAGVKDFPCKEKFDRIIEIKYDTIFLSLLRIIMRFDLQADVVIVSNPVLLVIQILVKKISPHYVVLLEDGLMNYYKFSPSDSIIKKWMQRVLFISDVKTFALIAKTYLLKPDDAVFYFGEKKTLTWNRVDISLDTTDFLHKKIFVGQNIYAFGKINIEEYNRLVNSIIEQWDIDYYIPHLYASSEENIVCKKIDLNLYQVTLEMIASKCSFTIFSLGSSVLYTTKCINPSVRSVLVKKNNLVTQGHMEIIERMSDEIIYLEEKEIL